MTFGRAGRGRFQIHLRLITIGRYGFVGAGAVVNKNVPDHGLVVGNPGKVIGWVCKCGERLSDDLDCLACGSQYGKTETGLKPTSVSPVEEEQRG